MKNHKIQIVILSVLFILFFLVKFQGPKWVESVYQSGTVDVLNRISGVQENQSLDFYLGKMDDALFGPLTVLTAGIFFLLFSFTFLRDASLRIFILAVFVFLLVTKFEVLWFPPYGDAVGGPFAEAIWLHRHNFDYVGLYHQPGYIEGGPRVYMFSIYPGFLALLMKIIPWTKAFLVVNHLMVFAFAATAVAILRDLTRKYFSNEISLFSAVLFMSLPLFHSQVEAINMEMMGLFLCMLSLYYTANKKMGWAFLFAALAAFMKGYHVIAGATVFTAAWVLFFGSPEDRNRKKYLLWGCLAGLASLAKIMCAYLVTYQYTPGRMTNLFSGWPSLRETKIVLPVFLFSITVYCCYLILWKVRQKTEREDSEPFLKNNFVPLVMFIFAGMWFFFFLNFFAVSPRYVFLFTPFLIFGTIFALKFILRDEKIIYGLFVPAIVLALICSYGLFYPEIGGYNYVLEERSLEYRNDLKLNMKVARELEDKFENFTIGAPFIVAQSLALPEMGYVQKKLNIMIYAMHCSYGGIKNFQGLGTLDLKKTIWVGTKSDMPDEIEYPISKSDIIIKKIEAGDHMATLFLGGVAIERVRLMREFLLKQSGRQAK